MMSKKAKKNNDKGSKGLRRLKRLLLIFWVGILGSVGGFALLILLISANVFGDLPSVEDLANPQNELATEIWSADGEMIGKYFSENRQQTDIKEINQVTYDALLSTEDERFYSHSGIDSRALFRAIIKNGIMQQRSAGGASTITQQLAKNMFPRGRMSKVETILRKIKEWVIAVRLERNFTKEEILAMYLNKIEFVNNAFGIKSAARVYFNTTPEELKIEEAAVLVGMVKNPSLYNPNRFPERAQGRRDQVFLQMVKNNKLSQEDCDSLRQIKLKLDFQAVDHHEGLAPYMRERIRVELRELANNENRRKPNGEKWNIYKDGLKIYTTIDSKVQAHAEQAVEEHMKFLQGEFFKHWKSRKDFPWNWNIGSEYYQKDYVDKQMRRSNRYRKMKRAGVSFDSIQRSFAQVIPMKVFDWDSKNYTKEIEMSPLDSIKYHKMILRAAFMAVDPRTGDVLAYVGGINHKHFQVDHIKAKRQVGSTFKPFVYLTGIADLGLSPCHREWNTDVVFEDFDNWSPKNSGYKSLEGEMITVQKAMALSLNKITAKIIKKTGPQAVVNYAHQLGITTEIPPYPSICLGTVDMKLEEMVGAYTAFGNRGYVNRPSFIKRVEDKNGTEITEFRDEIRQHEELGISEESAYVMLQFLKGVTQFGTGMSIRTKYGVKAPIGGKTGTTQENADGWFMSVTPDFVTGTWVGGDDPCIAFRNMQYGQGARLALPIAGKFLSSVYADKTLDYDDNTQFPKPLTRISVSLDCSQINEGYDPNYNPDPEDPYDDLLDIW